MFDLSVKEKGWKDPKDAKYFVEPVQTPRDITLGLIGPHSCKLGPTTTLSNEKEETLVANAEFMAKLSYGYFYKYIKRELVLSSVLCGNNKKSSRPSQCCYIFSGPSRSMSPIYFLVRIEYGLSRCLGRENIRFIISSFHLFLLPLRDQNLLS